MSLSNSNLFSLYNIVRDRYNDIICGDWEKVKEEIPELHLLMYKLLKLQEGQTENVPTIKALRNAKELKVGYHYITGRSPRPTAIWYDLQRTCNTLHGITWHDFNSPGFDFKAHTERRTAQAFEAARRNQKK